MTPEEHELWHQREAAWTLVKNFNVLADYLEDSALRLIFRNRSPDIFSTRGQQTPPHYFEEDEADVIADTMRRFRNNAERLAGQLPEEWALPKMLWRAPPGDRLAEVLAAQFRRAAEGYKQKLKTLPPAPGWRGWGQRISSALGL